MRGCTLIERYDCGFASLTCEEDPVETPETLISGFIAPGSDILSIIVLAFDGTQSSGGREQGIDFVLVDEFPKDSGIGGADGFTFVEDGCGAVEEGRVDDVCVSDDLKSDAVLAGDYPANVACTEYGFIRFDVEDEFHRVYQLNGISPGFANNS
jgi:hypothetical protein